MEQDIKQQLTQILHSNFGFKSFRKGQLEALTELMSTGRLLCIQPTGHGKSLLYQLPAIILEGITLVISPLLALMRDQLKQLKDRFNISAVSFNTDQTIEENNAARNAILAGKIRLLFIAPEQLEHVERFNFLLGLPIKLLVVDEAHCISTWGHDFRPSYRQILHLTNALYNKNASMKLLALTATANKKTESDIKQQLMVNNQSLVVYRESMDRPNIRLCVLPINGTVAKLAIIIQLLAMLKGSGLIYCATRENTEIVADFLISQGVKAAAYHAGLDMRLKHLIQHNFIHDVYTVISATNALGMGIDKSNLRFIIHFDHPGSLTAYYQEVGRAGRDGLPAEGILLYDPSDRRIQQYFIESAQPKPEDFQLVLNHCDDKESPSPELNTLKRKTGMHPTKLLVIIAELVEQGFLKKEIYLRKQLYLKTQKKGFPDLNRYINQRKIKNIELKALQHYAEQTITCLMATLRQNLGDSSLSSCGQCCICSPHPLKKLTNNTHIIATLSWFERRTIPITLHNKITDTITGMAALDGKARSADFVYFMRERAHASFSLGLSDTLFELIKDCLHDINKHYLLSCIISIPSKTWHSRTDIIKRLANELKIPALFNILYWSTEPSSRQGELLNNDQRQHNVANKMYADPTVEIRSGAIILFDDYIGSGSTLNEAARALREHGKIKNPLLPFTIAALKWRLGKKGMIQ